MVWRRNPDGWEDLMTPARLPAPAGVPVMPVQNSAITTANALLLGLASSGVPADLILTKAVIVYMLDIHGHTARVCDR